MPSAGRAVRGDLGVHSLVLEQTAQKTPEFHILSLMLY